MEHIREFSDQGCCIQLDLKRQVLGLNISEPDRESTQESLLLPTHPRSGPEGFVSAAALAMKAKQFDDGLYAAIELAAQNGAGRYPGKAFLLRTLAQSLAGETSGDALAILFGACELGRLSVMAPPSAAAAVKEKVAEFLAQELRSKPIGFYTWSPDLESIFRQDRLLQSGLGDEAGIKALVRALSTDDQLRIAYVSYLNLTARLTNPFAEPDLCPLLTDNDRQQTRPENVCFFPPSKAHETDLIMKLFSDRPIPDGINLMDELIARIRSGDVPLKPTEQSGWYDYQIWSIEPLAIPEKMTEAKHLQLDNGYRNHLLELFKGIYTQTRETHVKQLTAPKLAAAPGGRALPPRKIYIRPELSAEPLVTYYLRRSLTYRFVRRVIAETFGPDAVRRLHRLTPTDPSKLNLAEELDDMQALFYGAHATVSRQLGLTPDSTLEVGSGKGPEADAARFKQWARTLEADGDLRQDARMMVPVFYDVQRRKTKVWIFLGWTSKPLRIYFHTPPRVVHPGVRGAASVIAGLFGRMFGRREQIVFTDVQRYLACPVTAEVYVASVLNRDEFRRHCDTYQTRSAILENLP